MRAHVLLQLAALVRAGRGGGGGSGGGQGSGVAEVSSGGGGSGGPNGVRVALQAVSKKVTLRVPRPAEGDAPPYGGVALAPASALGAGKAAGQAGSAKRGSKRGTAAAITGGDAAAGAQEVWQERAYAGGPEARGLGLLDASTGALVLACEDASPEVRQAAVAALLGIADRQLSRLVWSGAAGLETAGTGSVSDHENQRRALKGGAAAACLQVMGSGVWGGQNLLCLCYVQGCLCRLACLNHAVPHHTHAHQTQSGVLSQTLLAALGSTQPHFPHNSLFLTPHHPATFQK